MKIGLWLYNQRSFERKILKENKKLMARELKKEIDMANEEMEEIGNMMHIQNVESPLKNYLKAKGITEFDMGTLRELMSYEMFMELAVHYLRKEKKRRR